MNLFVFVSFQEHCEPRPCATTQIADLLTKYVTTTAEPATYAPAQRDSRAQIAAPPGVSQTKAWVSFFSISTKSFWLGQRSPCQKTARPRDLTDFSISKDVLEPQVWSDFRISEEGV